MFEFEVLSSPPHRFTSSHLSHRAGGQICRRAGAREGARRSTRKDQHGGLSMPALVGGVSLLVATMIIQSACTCRLEDRL
eukprot:653331-Hanusia_phi.AAC.1